MRGTNMARMAVLLRAAALLVILASTGCAQPSSATTATPTQDMRQEMDTFLQAYLDTGKFIGSALVARGDEVLLSQGYGMANLELDVPNTPETVFRLGSLTKQFTAAAILQLQDQGRLNVNDTLGQYLPDAPHADEVTLAQLLSHSSGIPDAAQISEGASYGEALRLARPVDEIISQPAGQSLAFTPGSQYHYCNVCYVMLGRIVEKVSGQPYADYLAEHIFQPAGMTSTGYDDAGRIIDHRATGYNWDGTTYRNSQFIDMSNVRAVGDLVSTVLDMYKWDRALYTDTLVSAAARDAYFTPRISRGEGSSYAYGWVIRETPEHTLAEHSGEIMGFVSFVIRDPATQLYVVVLSNVEDPAAVNVAQGLAAIAYGEPYDVPGQPTAVEVDPAVLEKYAGTYQFSADMTVTITAEAGHLFAQVPDQPKFELFPESETDFFAKIAEIHLHFETGADGAVTEVVIMEGGQEIHAPRLP
jgi:CubicO group peptidase (beta-lactamase class C family)